MEKKIGILAKDSLLSQIEGESIPPPWYPLFSYLWG